MRLSFIKITDNNDCRNYYIDVTRMADVRIRVGILYSRYSRGYIHEELDNILKGDWSFCCVKRVFADDYSKVKEYKNDLYRFYDAKLVNYKKPTFSNIITFSSL